MKEKPKINTARDSVLPINCFFLNLIITGSDFLVPSGWAYSVS
jgi:hypothetical protein